MQVTRHPVLWRAPIVQALLLSVAATAHAANDEQTCLRGKDLDDARLEACARYIKSGKARGWTLALAYNVRETIWYSRGEFDRALEEENEAIRLAQGVGRPRDVAVLLANRGTVYWKKGDYDRALADLDEAVRLDAKNAEAYAWRSRAHFEKGDYDRALADGDKAVRLTPKKAESYLWRGDAYRKKQDYDRAIADYTKALKLDPSHGEDYVSRCEAYDAKGDFDSALVDCDEGLRRNPKLPSGYLWRGIAYENKGELDKARADYEHALSIDSTLQDARDRLFALSQRSSAPAASDAAPSATPAAPTTTPATSQNGGVDIPAASGQGGDVRQLLEKFGIIGTWSRDCSNLASSSAEYSVYQVLDDDRVQRDTIQRAVRQAGIVASAVEAGPNEIIITWLWDSREVVRLHLDGNRWRQTEVATNGVKIIEGGIHTANSGQPGKNSPWANRCQALSPAPGTSEPGSARQILENYGVLGVWSADCNKPASPSNVYIVYRALDEKRVQSDAMKDPKERAHVNVIESAEGLGPNEITLTQTSQNRDVYRLHIEGNRVRPLELMRNGTKYVADGRHLANISNPALIGKETPWVNKCK
jgi:tetratricopeptide (TPR) repeat protein